MDPRNPAANGHLPSFITAPGHTDVLMVVTAIILLAAVLLYLRQRTLWTETGPAA